MRGRRYPDAVRGRATTLRASGWSLQEISEELGVPKNTLSGWVRDVPLNDAQRARLQQKWLECAARGRPLAVEAWRRKIEQWKAGIHAQVSHFGSLPFGQPDIGRLACGLLYVCEGARYPASRRLSFANSDPRMIVLFLRLLRDYFVVDERKFRVRIMHRWDQDGEALKRFWSGVAGIALSQFHPSYADARTKGQPTQRAGYQGVCGIEYHSTTLQYTLQAIGESVLNLAANQEGQASVDDDGSGMLSESEPPCYRTVYDSVFPEREEIKLVEQEGIEPSASSMPSRRSVQAELLPHVASTITLR